MKLTDVEVPDNPAIERLVVSDDGSLTILYKGPQAVELKSGGESMTVAPVVVGPSLQIRRVAGSEAAAEMAAQFDNQIDSMKDVLGAQVEAAMQHIVDNAESIIVREKVDGAVGSFSLAELPPKKAIEHAFRLYRRGTEPVKVVDPEKDN